MELELESLIIPEVDSIKEPGHLVMDLPRLWGGATIEERRLLLLAMLDAVYVDTKHNLVVDVKPKTPFRSLPPFAVEGSDANANLYSDHASGPLLRRAIT